MIRNIGQTLILLGVLFASFSAFSGELAGKVLLVRGAVSIIDAKGLVVADTSGKRSRKVELNSEFFVGETIRTGEDGRIKIEFVQDKNSVVLGTSTTLIIEKTATSANQVAGTLLNLAKGEVRSSVNRKYSGKNGDAFEVKTANAVAGVRGTVFLSKFDSISKISSFATEKGAVFVKDATSGKAVMVNAGMFTRAGNGEVIAPQPISSDPEISGAVAAFGGQDSGESSEREPSSEPAQDSNKNESNKSEPSKSDSGQESNSQDSKAEANEDSKQDSQQGASEKQEGKSEKKVQKDNKVEKESNQKADNKSDGERRDSNTAKSEENRKGESRSENSRADRAPARADGPSGSPGVSGPAPVVAAPLPPPVVRPPLVIIPDVKRFVPPPDVQRSHTSGGSLDPTKATVKITLPKDQ